MRVVGDAGLEGEEGLPFDLIFVAFGLGDGVGGKEDKKIGQEEEDEWRKRAESSHVQIGRAHV